MDRRIEEISDERLIGNGWFVYLKPGFAFRDAGANAQHCMGFDTKREIKKEMRFVKLCYCADCKNLQTVI